MKTVYSALCRLQAKLMVKKEEGATMVEYGLLVALIAVACIAAITLLGGDLGTLFNNVAANVASA